MSNSDLRRAWKAQQAQKQDVTNAMPALMGNGHGIVEVPNQPGYVYIRLGQGDLGRAFNNRCPLADNLAIYVGYDPVLDPDRRIFQVLSVRMADYAGAGGTPTPNVAQHHTTHEYGGGDDVYVNWRRLMGFRVGRPSGFQVTVDEGVIIRAGAWLSVASQTLDLTALKPAGALACYVLIVLNAAGVATATAGASVAVATLDISDCPVPGAGEIPLAAVRLYGAQTAIGDVPTAPDIVDLRFPQSSSTGDVHLEDLSDYARGHIIRGGAADWESYHAANAGFIVQGDGTDVKSATFDWDVFSAGAGADMVHDHSAAGEGGKLTQANTHESPDTDVATTSLHHTIGVTATTAAAGNHTHAAGADEKAKVSANDTTAGYLNGKLIAGTYITLTENNDGGNETLTISASSSGGDHVHGLFRWAADGGTTVDLPDIAEYIETISDDGAIVDPVTWTLSTDGSQVTFDSGPTAASVMTAEYVIARI